MTPIFPDLPADLGVYTLTRLLGSHETFDRYFARQNHVERSVVIDVLRPDSPQEILDAFLRTARVRVAVSAPHVSQVLETMISGNVWYITCECPEGLPLSQLREEGRRLSTIQTCTVIQRVGEFYDYCARKKLAAGVLTPDSIFISAKGNVSLLSSIAAGSPPPGLHALQLDALADSLQDIRPEGEAGQTRVATLLSWLGLEFDGQRMEWQAVVSTAAYIAESVAPSSSEGKTRSLTVETPYARKRHLRYHFRNILKCVLIVSGCLLCAGTVSMLGFAIAALLPPRTLPAVHGDYVHCRADETEVSVMSAPVSIGKYGEFLKAYAKMPDEQRNEVNKGIPGTDTDHTPAEWEQQFRAAAENTLWHRRTLTTDSPVCGVSYWDAVAYANYCGASLPSADVLYTVRKATAPPPCEEWTDTFCPAEAMWDSANLVLPVPGAVTPRLESALSEKKLNRSFRLFFPANPHQES